MRWREFWLIRNKVKKLWKIRLTGKSYTVVAGRKGADGRATTKTFATKEEAESAYLQAISITLGKGYREGGEQPPTIWHAMEEGNITAVRRFLRANPELRNARGYEGETPLHAAVRNGRCDMAKLLLEAGADINAMGGEDDATPFGLAISDFSILVKTDVQMVELLLQYHPDVTLVDRWGETLLYKATKEKELAKLLSKHGIAPDPDPTPKLLKALEEKGMAYVRKQLAADPQPLKSPRVGEVMDFALGCGKRAYGFVTFLLDNGVSPNVTCRGQPLIESAVINARGPELVRLLLERGADLKRLEKGGRKLLLEAIYLNKGKEIIDLLFRHGVKKDLIVQLRLDGVQKVLAEVKQNPALVRELETPVELMNLAIQCAELVELLLKLGVDPNAHGTALEAPLRLAVRNVNLKLVRLLLDHGANPVPNDVQAGIPMIYGGFREEKAKDVKAIADLLLARGALTWPNWQADWEKRLEAAIARRARGKKK